MNQLVLDLNTQIKEAEETCFPLRYKGADVWGFFDSPDAGQRECVCSACCRMIDEDSVPIRIFETELDFELRFHYECWIQIEVHPELVCHSSYYAALKLVEQIDLDLARGIRHYWSKAGQRLGTLDEVVNAILDDELMELSG